MSADRVTVTVAWSLLLAALPSAGLWPETVAVLVMLLTVDEVLRWVGIMRVPSAPAASGPTARLPVQALLPTSVASHAAPVQRSEERRVGEGWTLRGTAQLSDGP